MSGYDSTGFGEALTGFDCFIVGGEDSGERIIKVANGNLFISPVKESDSGIYNCTVSNKYGQNSTQGNLTVLSKYFNSWLLRGLQ